ncbi:MAG TPA: glycoside hydrolase family 57 protein [Nitrospirota bacterium]|nr:glycoside hydrolase family 57 protein [Nitrospirota bacterium]
MSDHPLYIAFVWHMHQPYYKDDISGSYILPWVRMHGIKDYYDMPALLTDFPDIHQTFNLVPSLLKQITDYVDNEATDKFLTLTLKPASELDQEDKMFLLKNSFLANWDTMIKPYPGYWQLLDRRGYSVSPNDLKNATRYYTKQDYLDLQVWFNLTWFGPSFKQKDPFLQGLVQKGSGFSEKEKLLLIKKQREIMALIIPEYRQMAENGRIELTTTPFYHPILPLLFDTDLAKVAAPDIRLPAERFAHPEDARIQIERAMAYHENLFGSRPLGMWPSEGSVAEEIVPLLADAGIKWIGSDEGVLARSLGKNIERDFAGVMKNPEILYKPYLAGKGDKRISIIFRDRTLSDLIGFVYSKWDYKNAVHDLVDRLHRVRRGMSNGPNLVSIILDGENAWEYYQNDGRDFFLYLYERLNGEQGLRCVTVGEYLREHPAEETLERLHAGSWINANYRVWIGHEEDNQAWDLLSKTRKALTEFASRDGDSDKLAKAWEEIYIAEGSDWCWWYGDDHYSENDEEFDLLFRTHLMNVYRIIGLDVPDELQISILREDRQALPTVELTAFISPTIDGQVTNYFEWLSAGFYDVSQGGGAMHRGASIITHIYYGFDLKNMFFRLDPSGSLKDEKVADLAFFINFLNPKGIDVEIRIIPQERRVSAVLYRGENGIRQQSAVINTVAANDIIELAISFDLLGVKANEEIQIFVTVERSGSEVEKWPYRGYIQFKVPTDDFEAMMWQV